MTHQQNNRYNLLSQSQGARIVFATDEWFASASNLINDSPPVFIPDLYSEQGKVMDGWESRRKRTPGHDWCLIALAWSSSSFRKDLQILEVDTAYFTGNHVPRISVQIASVVGEEGKLWERAIPRGGGGQGTCASPKEEQLAQALCESISSKNLKWFDLLPITPLNPGYEETRYHSFKIPRHLAKQMHQATHLRVNYFPDGGVARMKLWADVDSKSSLTSSPSITRPTSTLIDLACSTNGGRGIGCSNRHYGEPSNLIQPTTGKDMGDGWETARHPNRPPVLKLLPDKSGLCDFSNLMDWCVLALGKPCDGGVKQIIVDTKHFKGNFPESVRIEACKYDITDANKDTEEKYLCRPPEKDVEVGWFVILPRVKLTPDAEHVFKSDQITNSDKIVTHVRVTIWPDGGLSRIRILGDSKNSSIRSFL